MISECEKIYGYFHSRFAKIKFYAAISLYFVEVRLIAKQ